MTNIRSPRLSRSAVAYLGMIAMTMIWGAMFVLMKEAFARIEPQWFNTSRMIIGFIVLAMVMRSQFRGLTKTAWIAGGLAGLAMSAGFFFQAQGLLYTSATNSALLTAMMVVFVPFLVCIPGLRKRGAPLPHTAAWLGAILAFVGVVLLTTPAHTPWLRLIANLNRGDLLTLLCAVGFALQIVAVDRAAKVVNFQQLTLLQIGFGMVFLTLGALVTEPPSHKALAGIASGTAAWMDPFVLFAVLVAGLLATALAFAVQTWAQQIVPPTSIAVIVTLEPVFAWITAFFVLHERLDLRGGAGALLVLAGVLATELLPRLLERPKAKDLEARAS